MNPTIKARIESIRRGEVPEGYKRTKAGILPVDWEFNPLSQLAQKSKTKNREERYTKILTNSANEGIISQTDYFDKQIANNDNIEGYYIVKKGDFVYNPRISVAAPCGPINCYHGEETGVMSPLYTVFSIDVKKIERDYVEQFFSSTFWHRYMKSVANYGVRSDRMNLSDEDFFLLPIPMPKREEQEKIAEILAGQDRVIELKEKLLAEKQKQKKYLMQQLLTSKKRLPGFFGKRKNLRLFDLCQIIADGDWIESKDQSDRGVRLIQTGNIGIGQFQNKSNKARYISEETFTRLSCCEVFPGDVLLSRLPDPIGRACKIPQLNCRMITAVDCTILRFKKDVFADLFIYYSCLDAWQNKMVLLSGGSTRKRITRKEIENAVITLPVDEAEQTAIAEILSTADKEIELLKKDIEQEKLKKKSLMQLLLTGIVRVDELVS